MLHTAHSAVTIEHYHSIEFMQIDFIPLRLPLEKEIKNDLQLFHSAIVPEHK